MEQNIWNELSKESKDAIIKEYNFCKDKELKTAAEVFESLFGRENLAPKPQIKTWEDLEKNSPITLEGCHTALGSKVILNGFSFDSIISKKKIINKAIATIKIAILTEHYYGGMITNEEWQDLSITKYAIYKVLDRFIIRPDNAHITFPAFHKEKQAEEFLKYNEQLLNEYNMICYGR